MISNIIWDFDGVILDSIHVRDYGFRKIFAEYDNALIEKLIEYHTFNGGLSRFVKIRYFFEQLLGLEISEKKVLEYAESFSKIMRKELINPKNLIIDSLSFIKDNCKTYNFHIASGSEQNELIFLCRELGLYEYFKSINGSPTPKTELVNNIITSCGYEKAETVMIGDSINDYDAAYENEILFWGYNNLELKNKGYYVESFLSIKLID